MIKKINIALLISFAALFAIKLLLDAADGAKSAVVAENDVQSAAQCELAPNVYYFHMRPYCCPDPISRRNGILLDTVRAVFPNANFIKLGFCPDDYVKLLQEDPHAVVVEYGDHPQLTCFPRGKTPVGTMPVAVYIPRSSKWKYTGPDSLAELKIGILSDYCDSEIIRSHLEKYRNDPDKVVEVIVGGDSDLQQMTRSGKIDAFVGTLIDMYSTQEHSSREMLTQYRMSDQIDKVELAFRCSNVEPEYSAKLIEVWESGYENIRTNGVLRRISEYYGCN